MPNPQSSPAPPRYVEYRRSSVPGDWRGLARDACGSAAAPRGMGADSLRGPVGSSDRAIGPSSGIQGEATGAPGRLPSSGRDVISTSSPRILAGWPFGGAGLPSGLGAPG